MSAAGSNGRVLIVDEHQPSMIVLRITLRTHGYTCDCAETADAAIERVRIFRPEIVIYEWNMDAGIGLPARLRRAASAHHLSIGVITLSSQDEPSGFIELEGVDDYVRKPYDFSALEVTIARVRGCIATQRSAFISTAG